MHVDTPCLELPIIQTIRQGSCIFSTAFAISNKATQLENTHIELIYRLCKSEKFLQFIEIRCD